MANTKLTDIVNLMLTLIPEEYKTQAIAEQDIAKLAVINYAINTAQNVTFSQDIDGIISVDKELSIEEQYYIALLSYKFYLMRLKDEFNRGAINFKTITFEVKSLEERAKQVETSIKSIDKRIEEIFVNISLSNEIYPAIPIIVVEFGGDWNG